MNSKRALGFFPFALINHLEKFISGFFNVRVAILGITLFDGDPTLIVNLVKVPVGEMIVSLRVNGLRQVVAQIPIRLVQPAVLFLKIIFLICRRLSFTPIRLGNVLSLFDEFLRMAKCISI